MEVFYGELIWQLEKQNKTLKKIAEELHLLNEELKQDNEDSEC